MEMREALIAPCGMNCRLCYGYIRVKNKCNGRRSQDGSKPTSCSKCSIVNCEKLMGYGSGFCYECDKRCRRLKYLDKRYREKYHMSMVENLYSLFR